MQFDFDVVAKTQLFFCYCAACFIGYQAWRMGIRSRLTSFRFLLQTAMIASPAILCWFFLDDFGMALCVLLVAVAVFTVAGLLELLAEIIHPISARAHDRKIQRINAQFNKNLGDVPDSYHEGSIVDKRV
jgi:hypothetical protein